ncbi:MAG TPA: hypothetical protein VFP95_00550 [Gammaproteobacteria bacterium]|nr:hypothetical protein [Gammaproteobacteria bacterium]
MRTVEDHQGASWQVAVSKESYGALFLLFCRDSDNQCRRYIVNEETLLQAEQALVNMTQTALQDALSEAEPL